MSPETSTGPSAATERAPWDLAFLRVGTLVSGLVTAVAAPVAGVLGGWGSAVAVLVGAATVVGFFVVPVVGLFLGFVLGVWLAELVRLPERSQAWTSTRAALAAAGASILIELFAGLLATGAWITGLVVG